MTKLIIDYIRLEHGNSMVDRLLNDLRDEQGELYTEKLLCDIGSWVPWEIKLALLDRAVEMTGNVRLPYMIGEAFPQIHIGSLLDVLARSITRPNRIAIEMIGLITKYNAIARIEIVERGSHSIRLNYRLQPGHILSIYECELNEGLLANVPRLFRLPPAQVQYLLKEDSLGSYCEYQIIWQVANVPRFTYWGLILGGVFGLFTGGITNHWTDMPSIIGMLFLNAVFGLVFGALLDRWYWTKQAIELITEQGENLQRFTADLQRRSRDLAALSEIAHRLTSILNPELLLSTILDELEQLLHFTTAELYLYHQNRFELVATRGLSAEAARKAAATAQNRYPGLVVKTRHPILANDITAEPAMLVLETEAGLTINNAMHYDGERNQQPIHSLLCVPIFYRNRCLGVIGLGSSERGAFSDDDLQLVTTFANQAAVAIENARLYEASQRQVSQMDRLRQISLSTNSTVDLNMILKMIVETASQLAHADSVLIQLATNQDTTQQTTNPAGLTELIMHSGNPFVVNDVTHDPRLSGIHLHPDAPRAFVALPLVANEHKLGVLYVNSITPRQFSPEEMNLLMLLSNQAAVAISNAQLYRGLNEEKQRVESLINNMSEGLFTVDDNLQITGWNPAAEVLTGWTAPEVLGKRCADVLQTPRCAECPMKALQQGNGTHSRFEYSILTKSGQRIPTLAGYATTRSADKTLIASVAVLNDITRLKEVERLKDSFVSMVSHEFRTPLTNIIAYADAVHSIPMDADTSKEFTGVIYDEGKRLASLVEDVLTLARVDMGNWEIKRTATDITEVLNFCSSTFRQAITRHELYMLIEQPLPLLMLDRSKLIQILNNLISNAIKYSPKGGLIVVQSWLINQQDLNDTIPVASRNTMKILGQELSGGDKNEEDIPRPGPTTHDLPAAVLKLMNDSNPSPILHPDFTHWLIISVTDHGIGIPSSAMGQLFQRFSRIDNATTRTVKGTGLGLAIVKAIIEAQKGRIWVASEEGRGSTFTIGLPVMLAPADCTGQEIEIAAPTGNLV